MTDFNGKKKVIVDLIKSAGMDSIQEPDDNCSTPRRCFNINGNVNNLQLSILLKKT